MDMVSQLVSQRPNFFANRAADQEKAIAITDFIYMSPGLSNAYMVLTSAGRVVINTGMGFESPVHKKVFDAVCPGPTPYILLTQGHVDHVGGVSLFREPQTKLVAQRIWASAKRMTGASRRFVKPSRRSGSRVP